MTAPARKPRAERQPTAKERLQALNERRAAGNGYVLPPPEGTFTTTSLRAWLQAVAEVGNPGDVELAWHFCQNPIIKGHLLNEYPAFRDVAGRCHNALLAEVAEEERLASLAHQKRARIDGLKRDLAAAEAKVSELKRKIAEAE